MKSRVPPHESPEPGGVAYRNELATAYQRIASLEATVKQLQHTTQSAGSSPPNTLSTSSSHEQVRTLEGTLARWDRLRFLFATLLACSGLLGLLVAERWGLRTALLLLCTLLSGIGITLAWPRLVRQPPDPKPWAQDPAQTGLRVAVSVHTTAVPPDPSEATSTRPHPQHEQLKP